MSNKFLHFNVVLHPSATLKQRKKYQSRTISVDPVSAQDIKNLASTFLTFPANQDLSVTVNVGITFLSLKDRYNKKEGRAEAIKRMAPVDLNVTAVQTTRTHIFVQLAEYNGVTLILRLNKTSGFSTVTGNLNIGA